MFRLTGRVFAVAMALTASGIVIGILVKQLLGGISELTTARVDSSQWTLSQLEVELLRLQLSLTDTQGPPALDKIRTRFDVFFSRVSTISNGHVNEFLSQDKEALEHIKITQIFLDSMTPIIDGADQVLLDSIPRLSAMVEDVHPAVRGLALRGVAVFGARSDSRRESLLTLLQRIAALTAALCASLVFLLFRLQRALQASEFRGKELRRTSERLATTISSSLDAVLVMNSDGTIIEFNGAAEEIFLISRRQAIGSSMHELIVPPEYHKAHLAGMERFLNTGTKGIIDAGRIQLTAIRGNGERFPIEFSVSTAEAPRGPIFISFLRDISEQLAAQNELLEARDNALTAENEKSRFIAVMSHEMRTPLNGIMGALELLQHDTFDPKQQSLLATAKNSSEILLEHVNDVLDISRLEAEAIDMNQEAFVPAELVAEVKSTMNGIAGEKGNRIITRVDMEARRPVSGDRLRIRQVLINLMSNALKATRHGLITLHTAAEINDDQTSQVTFRVTDQGIGIADADQERVFGDFVTLDSNYSRENEGTGLGLSISRRLVGLMKGSMNVESVPGQGSTFSFTIPVSIVTDSASAAQAEDGDTPTNQILNILLIEDNATNQLVASEMLLRMGHQVDIAKNGVEGVQAARNGKFDLILMDISMPKMDGVAATQQIRKLKGAQGSVPIVAMTAHALPSERDNFLAAGMQDCLIKPVRKDSLRKLVDNLGTLEIPQEKPLVYAKMLDEDTLLELIQIVGEPKFIKLIEEFCSETAASLPLLEQALEKEDFAELKALAHRLAGSSSTFGAQNLQRLLASMESASTTRDADATRRLLKQAHQEFETTRMELQSILDQD